MKFRDKSIFTTGRDGDVWLGKIDFISLPDVQTLLYVLKKGINCATIQNKPEG